MTREEAAAGLLFGALAAMTGLLLACDWRGATTRLRDYTRRHALSQPRSLRGSSDAPLKSYRIVAIVFIAVGVTVLVDATIVLVR
jgi:hypothetical protein